MWKLLERSICTLQPRINKVLSLAGQNLSRWIHIRYGYESLEVKCQFCILEMFGILGIFTIDKSSLFVTSQLSDVYLDYDLLLDNLETQVSMTS